MQKWKLTVWFTFFRTVRIIGTVTHYENEQYNLHFRTVLIIGPARMIGTWEYVIFRFVSLNRLQEIQRNYNKIYWLLKA